MIPYAIRNARGLRRPHSAHGNDGRSQAKGEDFHIYGSMSSSAAAPKWRHGFRGAGPKAPRGSVLAFERFGANRRLDGRLLAFPIATRHLDLWAGSAHGPMLRNSAIMIIFTFKQKQNSGRQG
jgi:hypothetical protein